jgi:hypothetical protein
MKPFIICCVLIALCNAGRADDWQTSPNIYSFKYDGPSYLTIPGQVSINLQDGSIQFDPGYTPDAAARQFWEAVSQEYCDMLKWKAEHPR